MTSMQPTRPIINLFLLLNIFVIIMSLPLSGKIALIIGAGSGIGRAACRLLNRDGATIVAADRNAEAAKDVANSLSGDNQFIELEVSNKQSIQNGLQNILNKFDAPPTIIVNAAGIIRDNFILKLDEDYFDDVIRVNLKGTFLIMQSCANAMVEKNVSNGTIINIGSIVSKMGNIGQANYVSSKAGVEAITKTASKEFGKFGIRVNCILPGFINTPMTESVPQKVKDIMTMQCALRRFGKPDEVAEVIAFLASDKSSYVNGASIEVTGGL
ncbi:estradiol 17-beta-dehydrogenase 8 [Contarinia nasturtii]|uniref:estradiol 17-beta-dehydrogenase 8 n=1 Tax=Contarinia nasturtii TaxID=265458 RepID=UPI0012D38FD1|nr:estradiol 17-beta-dehydrogenase 8 [Contarinia nasturtii]